MRLDKIEQTRLELLGGINIKWRDTNREESRKIFLEKGCKIETKYIQKKIWKLKIESGDGKLK